MTNRSKSSLRRATESETAEVATEETEAIEADSEVEEISTGVVLEKTGLRVASIASRKATLRRSAPIVIVF